MADLTVQDVPAGGLANVTFAAAAGGGDVVLGQGSVNAGGWELETVVLIVRNTDAATRTVSVGGGTGVVVPATTGVAVIPVLGEGRNDPGVAVTYSAVANLTVAAVRMGRNS